MKQSTQRILTTHVGSLPRPPDLLAMIQAKEQGEPFDAGLYASRVKSMVADVVKRQADADIDIIADGEMAVSGSFRMSTSAWLASSPARVRAAGAAGAGRASIWPSRNITNGPRKCRVQPVGRRRPNGCAPARFPIAGIRHCSKTSTI